MHAQATRVYSNTGFHPFHPFTVDEHVHEKRAGQEKTQTSVIHGYVRGRQLNGDTSGEMQRAVKSGVRVGVKG